MDNPQENTVTQFKKATKQPPPSEEGARSLPAIVCTDIDKTPDPRRFIYERLYIRGNVTGTAATGGTGKTSIVDVETIGMALGRNLLMNEQLRAGQLKVLVLSLEDPQDEYQRRTNAIKRCYMLKPEEVELIQHNLFQLFDRNGSFKLLYRNDYGLYVSQEVFEYLDNFIKQNSIDAMVIDPLISFHQADENNNIEMQQVLGALRELAGRNNTAIHYLHHNRKGGDSGADSMRGAVALRDGSRALRMLARMTEAEAQELNIPSDEAGFHIAMINGKSNFAPATNQKRWFKMEGINLDNETEDYLADVVGVATPWTPPSLFDGFSTEQIKAVWNGIKHLDEDERRFDVRAKNWVGHFVAEKLGIDVQSNKPRIRQMIHSWMDSGVLLKGSYHDSRQAKDFATVFFNEDHDLTEYQHS
jgi:hypothetical protein